MINERLESALAWCKKNNLDPTWLKKYNREEKRRQSKAKRHKLSGGKAIKHIQS